MAWTAWGWTTALGSALFLSIACGGDAFTSSGEGAGDGDSGDGDSGDGDVGGDGDGDTGGDGDDPLPGDGDGDAPGDGDNPGMIEAACETAADCLSVATTDAPCYSPGCSLPVPASNEDVERNPCLVPWTPPEEAPTTSDECRYESEEPVACPASCAQPPECVTVSCEAGRCRVENYYDAAACEGGGEPDCEQLNRDRAQALEEARTCVNGIVPECTEPTSVGDQCGCPVAVNNVKPLAVQAARDARAAWAESCSPPMECQLIDCAPAGDSSTCVDQNGDNSGVCEFQ